MWSYVWNEWNRLDPILHNQMNHWHHRYSQEQSFLLFFLKIWPFWTKCGDLQEKRYKAINLRPNDHKRNPLKTQKGKSWENFQGKGAKSRRSPKPNRIWYHTIWVKWKVNWNWCQNQRRVLKCLTGVAVTGLCPLHHTPAKMEMGMGQDLV